MIKKLKTKSIVDYTDAIFQLKYDIQNNGFDVKSIPFELLLRPFKFYNENFEDIYYAGTACMPIFGGYIIASVNKEDHRYSVEELKKTLEILVPYLDQSQISVDEHKDLADLLILPYDFIEKLETIDNILTVVPHIEEQEQLLQQQDNKGLQALMKLTPIERVEHYKDVIQSINTSKNAIYNLIREKGNKLLPQIEEHIHDLLPADQDFILHGLDAFPKSKKVIAFYERFKEETTSEYLPEQVDKYLERVKSGKKTTGWE